MFLSDFKTLGYLSGLYNNNGFRRSFLHNQVSHRLKTFYHCRKKLLKNSKTIEPLRCIVIDDTNNIVANKLTL